MGKKRERAVSDQRSAVSEELEVPTFTISADSDFGIRCMMAIASHAADMLSPDEAQIVRTKLREFDLYEEAIRTAIPRPGDPGGPALEGEA